MTSLYINNTPSSFKTINSTGNSVTIALQPPILLETTKKNTLKVLNANITYCDPNITAENNQFTYTYNGTTFTKTIPTGLYSLFDIDDTISRITNAQNGAQLFSFSANEATSTIIVYFLANTIIDCTTPNNIMASLGFPATSGQIGGFVTDTGSVQSTQGAKLNNLTQILISTNIVSGSYVNDQLSNVIAGVPINNVDPYSNILYTPIHPTTNYIFRNRIDSINITLSDQDGIPIDFTRSGLSDAELWNVTLELTSQ